MRRPVSARAGAPGCGTVPDRGALRVPGRPGASGWTRWPWSRQSAEADKRGNSATEDARRGALTILRRAVEDGVDLRDVALYHLVTVARDAAGLSAGMAAAELTEAGLEAGRRGDHRGAAWPSRRRPAVEPGRTGAGPARRRAAAGGRPAAAGLPAEAGAARTRSKRIGAARAAAGRAAGRGAGGQRGPGRGPSDGAAQGGGADQRRGRGGPSWRRSRCRRPASLHAVCDGAAVRLFWRPAAGHDAGHGLRRPPERAAHARRCADDGEPVFRDRGDSCDGPARPVARPLQYAVFALGGRPARRRARPPSSVTRLPPVVRPEGRGRPGHGRAALAAHPDASGSR